MPRKKRFEYDEAVEVAKKAFWKRGYQGLGIRSIEEETGLGRFAINTEFGGKEGLLIASLESYLADADTYILKPIREGADLSAVIGIIEGLVTSSTDSYLPYGCLVMNTTIENAGGHSTRVKDITDQYYADLRRELQRYFTRLRKNNHVDKTMPIKEMVEFVVGATIAINFLNRNASNVAAGRGFADAAIRTIKSWRPA